MGSLSILTVTLHILAWICTLQTLVVAKHHLNLTHYTHEIRGGPNSSWLLAAGAPSPSLAEGGAWGSFIVYDAAMRDGPEKNSTLIGRITGTVTGIVNPTTTGGQGTRVQLVHHHLFEDASIYNGSYINILGLLFSTTGPWELTVPGCTGALRGYSGYGISTPIVYNTSGPPPYYLVYKWDIYLTKA